MENRSFDHMLGFLQTRERQMSQFRAGQLDIVATVDLFNET
jgi:hypothetical protein